jgi:hypothetical protein
MRRSLVDDEGFGDLTPDAVCGLRRSSDLEDHRDFVATNLAHLALVSESSERRAKRTSPLSTLPQRRRNQALTASAVADLPDPDSPTTPSVWPASRSKGHAIHRLDDDTVRMKAHPQVTHVEKLARHCLVLHLHVERITNTVAEQGER